MNNAILQVDQPIFFPAALPVFRNDEAASKTFVVTLCRAENEDLVGAVPTGDAPTTSEWSAIISHTKLRLISEVWR